MLCLKNSMAEADTFGVGVLEMTPDVKEVGRDQTVVGLAEHGKGFAFNFKYMGQILQGLKLRKKRHCVLYTFNTQRKNSKIRK